MRGKQQAVKAFFERPEVYAYYDYNLRVRAETLAEFMGDRSFDTALDAPCGTGAITLPHAARFGKLDLVDYAASMVKLAKQTAADFPNVTVTEADIYDLPVEQYDLVVSLGILAHVDDPKHFLQHITQYVKPGGYLCLQNTDASHSYYKWIKLYRGMRGLFKKQYILNEVDHQLVEDTLQKDFNLTGTFRYNQSFLGFSHLFSNEKKYRLTRKWFGTVAQPKNQKRGSDYIYFWQRKT